MRNKGTLITAFLSTLFTLVILLTAVFAWMSLDDNTSASVSLSVYNDESIYVDEFIVYRNELDSDPLFEYQRGTGPNVPITIEDSIIGLLLGEKIYFVVTLSAATDESKNLEIKIRNFNGGPFFKEQSIDENGDIVEGNDYVIDGKKFNMCDAFRVSFIECYFNEKGTSIDPDENNLSEGNGIFVKGEDSMIAPLTKIVGYDNWNPKDIRQREVTFIFALTFTGLQNVDIPINVLSHKTFHVESIMITAERIS
ncbi:hypothetical protein LJC17_01595 [Acholeplasma sp. OttesenSCG-928-E16]|nr:hypothetical protein [Acholeplasma sp. OttesenSCG-928-E16]